MDRLRVTIPSIRLNLTQLAMATFHNSPLLSVFLQAKLSLPQLLASTQESKHQRWTKWTKTNSWKSNLISFMSTNNRANQVPTRVAQDGPCHHLREDRMELKEALATSVCSTNNLCKLSHKRNSLRMGSNFKITTKCLTRGLPVKTQFLPLKDKQPKLCTKAKPQTSRTLSKEVRIPTILLPLAL